VFGMMDQKPPQNFLRPLAPLVRGLRAVTIPGLEASMSAEEAAEAASEVDIPSQPSIDIPTAIQDTVRAASRPARVLICGSLYLAGSVLALSEGATPVRTVG